ncbi:DENN domain-containing protein Crag isoform X3 [Ischnura elegans]|uniref:DENN domain-containing protein Crag isoform X3 n=1 Tax=Ischnura elegans TaxID=197161 RepID=UPI001ED8AC00|nr:DENN domain-containing protein Crag isoform X3 [Ischnura elegans]
MDERRVADYFVVAGLPKENPQPLDDFSRDGAHLKPTHNQAPITDVTVIFRSLGERCPPGFTCIETTPSGYIGDLNHGSLRSPEVFLCYRRGRDKPPLVDIGVMYEGKERLMADSEVVLSTPGGHAANVNNSGAKTFVTYRRAPESMPCNELVVTDICVILTSKGETAPHAFCMIEKNLNKGMFQVGSDVYLCYKKSMNRANLITYKPGILARYPHVDQPNFPFPESVPMFCLPMGSTIECWPAKAAQPRPIFSTFVLTVSDAAEKVYGSAITFYERYPSEKLTAEQQKELDFDVQNEKNTKTVNVNKCICLLSHWPFFDTFEKFLLFLYNMSNTGPHTVPIERHISHFLEDIPFPSPQRPGILIQLSAVDTIMLIQPEDLPLPRSGASFKQMLMNLGPDNCLLVLLCALTEQKLLVHSLRPDVLTSVAEAISMLIFPFKWQCPYIPLCPLGLADVLHAPLPFLIGVDSRFFDLYDPPPDVNCVDLDTNNITMCEEKKALNVKILPKKPARVLRASLQTSYENLRQVVRSKKLSKGDDSSKDGSIDRDLLRKRKEQIFELEIQEAFLRFMATILKGYRSYLLPIIKAPTVGTTDPNSLFDLHGFLRSRDKTHHKFFTMVMKTQMFIRFIEERSFVSDMDASLAFFDECTEKVDGDDGDSHLLELDESHKSERTVFVMPPEPNGLPPGEKYSYESFTLNNMLFSQKDVKNYLSVGGRLSAPVPGSPLARRTKHEIKSAQKLARKHAPSPELWAKCLLGTCYSLWFIHLPSFVMLSPSKVSCLRTAYDILVKIQKIKLQPTDEVCYRVMMQLCGVYSHPVLAVKLLFEMKRHGIQPNALTYGFYNRAVLEAAWPSDMTNSSQLLWNKLRNVIFGVALFRQAGHRNARRRLSLSTDHVDRPSSSEADVISHTSVDSANSQEWVPPHSNASMPNDKVSNPIPPQPLPTSVPAVPTNPASSHHAVAQSGSLSDIGYSSMNENTKNNSLQQLDEERKYESGSDSQGLRNANSTSTLEQMAEVGPIKPLEGQCKPAVVLDPVDLSAFDKFRSRVGSIVKNSATPLIPVSSLPQQSYDSSAGLLMTGLYDGPVLLAGSGDGMRRIDDIILEGDHSRTSHSDGEGDAKEHHSGAPPPSPSAPNAPHFTHHLKPRRRHQSSGAMDFSSSQRGKLRHMSNSGQGCTDGGWPPFSSHGLPNSPEGASPSTPGDCLRLLRSESFANDAQILEKLNQLKLDCGKENINKNGPVHHHQFGESGSYARRKLLMDQKAGTGLHKGRVRGSEHPHPLHTVSDEEAEDENSETAVPVEGSRRLESDIIHRGNNEGSRDSLASKDSSSEVHSSPSSKSMVERTGRLFSALGAKVNKLSTDVREKAEARMGRRGSDSSALSSSCATNPLPASMEAPSPPSSLSISPSSPGRAPPRSPSIPIRKSPHSPARMVVTENDPLGAFAGSPDGTREEGRSGENAEDDREPSELHSSRSPSCGSSRVQSLDWEGVGMGSGGPLLFGDTPRKKGWESEEESEKVASSLDETAEVDGEANSGRSWSRSSLPPRPGPRASRSQENLIDEVVEESEGESGLEELERQSGKKKVIQRSSTMPVDASLAALPPASTSVASSLTSLSNSFKLPFRKVPSSITTKKSNELIMGGINSIKSAATSVAKKFDEIKEAISANSTPVKAGSVPHRLSERDYDDESYHGDGVGSSLSIDERRRRTSTEYSPLAAAAVAAVGAQHGGEYWGSNLFDLFGDGSRKGSSSNLLPNDPSASMQSLFPENLYPKSTSVRNLRVPMALEMLMTTCSKCHNCSSLLYDEEIMAGWVPEDSNLNTKCQFCSKGMVPFLTVTILDYRVHAMDVVLSMMTPAPSVESVAVGGGSSLSLNPPNRKTSIGSSSLNIPEAHCKSTQGINESTCADSSTLSNVTEEKDQSIVNETEEKSSLVASTPLKKTENAKSVSPLFPPKGISSSSGGVADSVRFSSSVPILPTDGGVTGRYRRRSESHLLTQPKENTDVDDQEKNEDVSLEPVQLELITVPYLNPLVLRKELENILDNEGDTCLTLPQFVDEHPIIYWNMVWIFQRINVVSHLPGLCLNAAVTTGPNIQHTIHASWASADYNNVFIRCLWDNSRLHEEVGHPMYVLWQQNPQLSSLISALLTDRTTVSRMVMQKVISGIRCNDLLDPLRRLATERQKLKVKGVDRRHSLYRDILFLAYTALGRENIDTVTFDQEYVKAYEKLSGKDLKICHKCDRPPSRKSLYCRHYFKELDL